jgi:hypothetical protein
MPQMNKKKVTTKMSVTFTSFLIFILDKLNNTYGQFICEYYYMLKQRVKITKKTITTSINVFFDFAGLIIG